MDDFDTQVQSEEVNFWDMLVEIIFSLPEDEREEIIAEIVKHN